jgi:hypothetical protein
LVALRPDRLNQKLIRNPDIRNRGAPIQRHRTHNFGCTLAAFDRPSRPLSTHAGNGSSCLRAALPCLCPNALPLKTATLGDKVGEILLFCRSSARRTVRPAGRFPIAGLGGAARVMPIWRK